jgi:hypothetical protein
VIRPYDTRSRSGTLPAKIEATISCRQLCGTPQKNFVMKIATACVAFITCLSLQGCAVVAVADVVASTVIYTGKTVINVIDAVTPDIVNKKKKD